MTEKRCIFLAGAPKEARLSWDEPALLSSFESPVKRFLEDETPVERVVHSTLIPKWRCIASDVQASWPCHEQSQYIMDLEFLEHSIAVLEEIDSSQIIDSTIGNILDTWDNEATFASFTTSLSLTETSNTDIDDTTLSVQEESRLPPTLNFIGDITDLRRIPKAEHIQRMHPQTMTVNLLVGVIAISPTRRVQLRRRKLEREIIEVTVGDETRAGFSISFWLVPDEGRERPMDELRQSLHRLRPGQLVLLQSVALSSFRGSVYGQSLSNHFARNSTMVTVLDDARLSPAAMAKLKRVREWATDFVGGARQPLGTDGDGKKGVAGREALPPDTQD